MRELCQWLHIPELFELQLIILPTMQTEKSSSVPSSQMSSGRSTSKKIYKIHKNDGMFLGMWRLQGNMVKKLIMDCWSCTDPYSSIKIQRWWHLTKIPWIFIWITQTGRDLWIVFPKHLLFDESLIEWVILDSASQKRTLNEKIDIFFCWKSVSTCSLTSSMLGG